MQEEERGRGDWRALRNITTRLRLKPLQLNDLPPSPKSVYSTLVSLYELHRTGKQRKISQLLKEESKVLQLDNCLWKPHS
ncbi:hypothetical protein TNCV_1490191 [Trichonephila clavipes]|nr:hypothetical protein TNCV_1490191 [Trichonephila clavipes]